VYDKEGGNMAGVRNKERTISQDVEGRHAPVLRCMHGMVLSFDEDAGAREYGGSTSRDVKISHRRRIERRISHGSSFPECCSDVTRKRTLYKQEDGCHYSLAMHNSRLYN
jgi:hypothetical protein